MRTLFAVHPMSLVFVFTVIGGNYIDINLPHDHVKYYFNSFPTEAEKCRNNTACPYKVRLIFNFSFWYTLSLFIALKIYYVKFYM